VEAQHRISQHTTTSGRLSSRRLPEPAQMATSFTAYASQFLTRQQDSSSLSSSQPLFYSFSTDEGSRAGNIHASDLDDTDDPHLRASEASRAPRRHEYDYHAEDEDDDP
jgi:hypothetical protein